MKILFLTREIPYPPDSGSRLRTFKILQFLSEKNKIVIFAADGYADKKNFEDILPNTEIFRCSPINKKSILFNLFSILPFGIKKRKDGRLKEDISSYIQKHCPDLVACDSIYQTINLSDRPFILFEHNIESEIIRRYIKNEKNICKKLFAYFEWMRMVRYETKIWNSARCVFLISQVDFDIFKKRAPNVKAVILPNGVDTKFFTPVLNESEGDVIVYIGRMNWYPNSDAVYYFLKEIFPLIKIKKGGIRFLIVGKDPDEKILKLAESDSSIEITGEVNDVRPFLAKSKLMVVPIRIGSGTRLKILEAMAMGIPVVSTSIGCEGLDVSPDENILVGDEPQIFAREVLRLLEDGVLRKEIGSKSRKFVQEKYDWEIVNKCLNSFFGQI